MSLASSSVLNTKNLGALPRPPLVKGNPLIGNVRALLKNPHEFVQQAYENYGAVFRFKAAHREYVVLAGAKANRLVSGEQKNLFSVEGFWGKAGEYMGCPHMLVMVDDERHAFQRNLMMPLLGQKAFKDRLNVLSEPVLDVIEKNQDKSNIRFGDFSRQMISNQIGFSLQGYKTSHKQVEQLIYYFGGVMNVFGLRKWPRFMLHTPRFKFAEHFTKKYLNKTISLSQARIKQGKGQYYLDTIMPAMLTHPEWFDLDDVKGHALLPFVAALDTVASTLGFIVFRLLQEPELYERVQREVDAGFSQGVPTLAQLRKMSVLNGLVKETLRLQPTAFGITRNATEAFEFEGYRINKGEELLIYTTADHRNGEYFPDPLKFDLERYFPERNEHRQGAYAPYGKGPHNCLGASLAEIIMPLNLGLLLANVKIAAACDLSKVKLEFNPAPVLSGNFRVSFVEGV